MNMADSLKEKPPTPSVPNKKVALPFLVCPKKSVSFLKFKNRISIFSIFFFIFEKMIFI